MLRILQSNFWNIVLQSLFDARTPRGRFRPVAILVIAGLGCVRGFLSHPRQYYNCLIAGRFIHLTRTFFLASPSRPPYQCHLFWGLILAFGFSFCPEPFLVCNVRVTRAAPYQRVCLCPRECVFFRAGSRTSAAPFFAEDFSACVASESAPVASSSQPSASRVRFLPVGSFLVAVPVIRGRIFKWSPPSIRGILASDDPFTSATLVGSPVAAI